MSIQSFIHFNQNITGILSNEEFEAFFSGKDADMKTSKARKGHLKNVLQLTDVIFILLKKSFGPLISI